MRAYDRTRTRLQNLQSGRRHRPAGCQLHDRGRRDLRHHRPVRRGQEHARALLKPSGGAEQRPRHGRRAGPCQPLRRAAARAAAQDRHDLSALLPAEPAHCAAERAVSFADRRHAARRGANARPGASGAGRAAGSSAGLPGAAVRRAEAARGHRKGARLRAWLPSLRRGHLRARPRDDGLDPHAS